MGWWWRGQIYKLRCHCVRAEGLIHRYEKLLQELAGWGKDGCMRCTKDGVACGHGAGGGGGEGVGAGGS